MQIALTRSYKKFDVIIAIETFLNDIANFYYGPSHKSAVHIKELADLLNLNSYRYHKIFHIRWISSERDAVMKVIKSYKLLLRDLEEISTDLGFSLSARNKAKDFIKSLKSKNLVHTLFFLADILRIITSTSQDLQSRDNLLIDLNRIMLRLIEQLRRLKLNDGLYMSKFYEKCHFTKYRQIQIRGSSDFDTNDVTFGNIELIDDSMDVLDDFRIELIDGIIEELYEYFPSQDYKYIEILNPTEIPLNSSDCFFYGVTEFRKICELFGFENQTVRITESFQHLLTRISEKSSFHTDRCGHFKDFWSLQLSDENLPWTFQTEQIIRSILSLPLSTSECERGFSVMKYIKDEKRFNLKPETLEASLRCKINGPRDERNFDARYYARAWINSNHMKSDDSAQQRKSKKTFDSFEKIKILTQLFFSEQKKLDPNPEKVDLDMAEIEPELEEDIFSNFD